MEDGDSLPHEMSLDTESVVTNVARGVFTFAN